MKILKPFELAYQRVAAARRALYRRGRLQAARLPRPVISIGNLAFGGTGKTPATIAIAKLLASKGVSVAILSRGHGRLSAAIERVTSPDPIRFGDEPAMMWRAFGGSVPIVVGSDRFVGGSRFLAAADCQVFLLDDGFQHVRLHRDCDIVLMTPHETLRREPLSSLRDADVIIARDGATVPAKYARRPTVGATLLPVAVTTDGHRENVETLRGRRVVAFSALANNEQFFATVASLGADLVATKSFRDHHHYTLIDIAALEKNAAQNQAMLLTTAKDAVKLPGRALSVLEAEMIFDDPETLLQEIAAKTDLQLR